MSKLCNEVSCAIFNETGNEVAYLVNKFIGMDFVSKKNPDGIGLCILEEEIRATGEQHFLCSFEIGSKNMEDC